MSAQACDRKKKPKLVLQCRFKVIPLKKTVKQQRNATYEKPYKNSCIFIRDLPYSEKAEPNKTAISIYTEVCT